jgi:NAD+ synthase
MRSLDLKLEIERIASFITDYVHSNGFADVVIGLSGGIDSSLAAALAVRALGKEHVRGAMLPYKTSSAASYEDALLLANELGIHHERIEITPLVDSYFDSRRKEASNLRRGNWMARARMCVLYDLSAQYKALVVGTSNRTELLVGYFTQFGDGACAFEPIGHLYKTEVWQMAELLNIPDRIIRKIPTADLWEKQTDEDEIGLKYAHLDEIVYLLTEQNLSKEDVMRAGFTSEQVDKVSNMISRSAFKRNPPPLISDWEDRS